MDTRQYAELYLAETREHLRALGRGLLELESTGGEDALESSFRSAHTIKGMSAAMGYDRVTRIAHELEDRLTEVRAGRLEVTPELVDALLASADALGVAVEQATAGPEPAAGESDEGSEVPPAEVDPGALQEGLAALMGEAEFVVADDERSHPAVRILLDPSAPLKAARATIIRTQVSRVARVLSSEPQDFGEDFDGNFRLIIEEGADREAVDSAIRSAGEVRAVSWSTVSYQASPGQEVLTPDPATGAPRGASEARSRLVRVDQRHLDTLADGIGEISILHARLTRLGIARADEEVHEVAERMDRLLEDLEHAILAVRMVPVGEVFDRFPRVVRDAARRAGKEVEFRVEGRDIRLDRSILDEIAEPLLHLLRNAVDHGIESAEERRALGKSARALLTLTAEQDRGGVRIRVRDDGRGISRDSVLAIAQRDGLVPGDRSGLPDDELLRLLSRPGFTTAEEITELSGRGVGLDVVVSRARSLGGAVRLVTAEGQGTTFDLRLPISLALTQALRVKVGGEDYVIPLTHVTEVVELNGGVGRMRGREVLRLREEVMPLVRLRGALGCGGEGEERSAVIAAAGDERAALAVDELVGREQIVVKSFEPPAGALPYFAGVTFLGDGRPALVLDPMSVL